MEWIISSVQICCTSIFLRSSSRAFSAFSNRSSTLRWSSFSRAMASGLSRLGIGTSGWVLRGENQPVNEECEGTFRSHVVQNRTFVDQTVMNGKATICMLNCRFGRKRDDHALVVAQGKRSPYCFARAIAACGQYNLAEHPVLRE